MSAIKAFLFLKILYPFLFTRASGTARRLPHFTLLSCNIKEMFTVPAAITTGLSDGENVEVLSGLSEGGTVYYRYADTLEYSFVK